MFPKKSFLRPCATTVLSQPNSPNSKVLCPFTRCPVVVDTADQAAQHCLAGSVPRLLLWPLFPRCSSPPDPRHLGEPPGSVLLTSLLMPLLSQPSAYPEGQTYISAHMCPLLVSFRSSNDLTLDSSANTDQPLDIGRETQSQKRGVHVSSAFWNYTTLQC